MINWIRKYQTGDKIDYETAYKKYLEEVHKQQGKRIGNAVRKTTNDFTENYIEPAIVGASAAVPGGWEIANLTKAANNAYFKKDYEAAAGNIVSAIAPRAITKGASLIAKPVVNTLKTFKALKEVSNDAVKGMFVPPAKKVVGYHASNTPIKTFKEIFPENYFAQHGGTDKAIFFTKDIPGPQSFLSNRPYLNSYELTMENPKIIDFNTPTKGGTSRWAKTINKAEELGHDGVIIKGIRDNQMDNSTIYVSLNPKNIKYLNTIKDDIGKASAFLESIYPKSKILYHNTVIPFKKFDATKATMASKDAGEGLYLTDLANSPRWSLYQEKNAGRINYRRFSNYVSRNAHKIPGIDPYNISYGEYPFTDFTRKTQPELVKELTNKLKEEHYRPGYDLLEEAIKKHFNIPPFEEVVPLEKAIKIPYLVNMEKPAYFPDLYTGKFPRKYTVLIEGNNNNVQQAVVHDLNNVTRLSTLIDNYKKFNKTITRTHPDAKDFLEYIKKSRTN